MIDASINQKVKLLGGGISDLMMPDRPIRGGPIGRALQADILLQGSVWFGHLAATYPLSHHVRTWVDCLVFVRYGTATGGLLGASSSRGCGGGRLA